ncbi:MAG TPA: hypothetical protein ENJ84_13100 [Gammaproteobacteria bacterium]|nr:hypothetical protein [Gammaproteobacteria bacterium]
MTGTAFYKRPKSNPLLRPHNAEGYRIGWKYKHQFKRGHLEEEMTYGEALERSLALAKAEPDKTFWPELMFETPD